VSVTLKSLRKIAQSTGLASQKDVMCDMQIFDSKVAGPAMV
jgi:hypothetical protein